VAIIVGGAHVGVLCLIQQTHYAGKTIVVQDMESIYLLSPLATVSPRTPATRKPMAHPQRLQKSSQDLSELSSAPSLSVPLPAASSAPGARTRADWQQAVDAAAADVIEKAKIDAARAARMSEPPLSLSFQPLHVPPHDFEWISEHSHLVINAQGVPEWVLIQPCAGIILRNDPGCTVEHIERHGPMFEYMQQQHEAALEYGGPNAVP
jgi:hypothetical protein